MTEARSAFAGQLDQAVTTRGLTKRFGRHMALTDVNLSVPDGAVYLLIGTNGAGKSTLFKVLMNLERANAGSAEVFGLDTATHGPRARASIGYVPEQHVHALGWMTCGALLRHVAPYYPSWEQAYAERLTSAVGLGVDRPVGSLSKGEARRLHLVLALAHRPPLLLLDEPTDGLDPVVRRRILELLGEHLADSPTTVLVSTHQIHELESLADHIGVLSAGQLVAQLPRSEMQRTVRRYRIEVPEGWRSPSELPVAGLRRSSAGREVHCTVVGDEAAVTERLILTGADVREVRSLSLEDAALAFLPGEDGP